MGERGFTFHVRGSRIAAIRRALVALRIPAALLARNDRWTSFALLDRESFDACELAERLGSVVLRVWFDEDVGSTLAFVGPALQESELAFPLDGDGLSEADRSLLDTLATNDVLTPRSVHTMSAHSTSGMRRDFIASHGVEEAVGVAFTTPMPVPLDESQLRSFAPNSEIVRSKKRASRTATVEATDEVIVEARAFTRRERAILDLHFLYMAELWSMNDWIVYGRYKKYLPPTRKREVDGLIDLRMRQRPAEEQYAALERILGSIWDSTDWNAVIREPDLTYDFEPEDLAEWRERLDVPLPED